MKPKIFLPVLLVIVLLISETGISSGQKKSGDGYLGKAELYKAKITAFEYLSDPGIVKTYGTIADSIWGFAELGMQEFNSSAILIRRLEQEGFTVQKGMAGMPTCFVARWGTGRPAIGILGEFDALPMISQKALTPVKSPVVEGGPGHGCGHNLMGTAGIAAAIAVKRSMVQNGITGSIVFFGSPAEETVTSRPFMVKAGLFNDIDAVIDNHASSVMGTGYGVDGTAIISAIFTFRGKTAHSAGSPWSGRSALDGVELMNIATNFLREHLFYTYRMHYVITEGGEAPNVVPDRASVWYYIRNTDERLEEMFNRVRDCARGAALASGTTLDTIRVITAIHQKHSNKGMAEAIQRNIELVDMPEWSEEENEIAKAIQKELKVKEKGYPDSINPLKKPAETQVGGGSTDVGEVTLIAPTATLNFPGGVPGMISHHWSSVASYYGSAAWKGLNAGAKVMAGTALDLLTKPQMLQQIRNEFTEYSKLHPYKSFLPEGTKPPVEFNKELMDKFRAAMREVDE